MFSTDISHSWNGRCHACRSHSAILCGRALIDSLAIAMKLPPYFDHYLKSAPLELTADTQRPDHSAEPQDEQNAHGVSACEVAACERGHYPEAQRRSQPQVQGARTCYGDRETYNDWRYAEPTA
ncbi:hypothetical protein GS397_05905 [Sphingobium yanoikuyae]|uniref:Uncharacterized protein n=2 Tax=Sphingobium TaxID=165695 RepID=A0A6P1GG70_SPHYA|nr:MULTISPECIES: hypothetical protein [Sphingobium]MBB4147282.1 ABC-type nickel/cobalt efflux system permease component RcnA [Sphingobium scionense]QHD66641.1 hypothetical protein GS397_05905 [Sphingobium yanoikuyae]